MKIQILSDLHIEFEEFDYRETNSDVLVLAGDIHIKDKGIRWALNTIRNKPVIYLLGNHEFYGKAYPKLVNSVKEMTANSNVHLLEKDMLTIDGVNFLGCTLWTDFALYGDARITGHQCQQIMTDFNKIRVSPRFSKIRSIDVASIHRRSLDWLSENLANNKGQTNVVITHHAPSTKSLPPGHEDEAASAAYVSNLESIIMELAPDYWIHGHLHHSSDYHVGRCKGVCNPRGYPDERNPNFKSDYVIDI